MLDTSIKKITIFSGLLYIFLLTTHYTTADIFAERNVIKNQFDVMNLDFLSILSYNKNKTEQLFETEKIIPYGYDIKSIRIENTSPIDFKYEIKTIITNPNELCNNINIKMLDKTFKIFYKGGLLNMQKNLKLKSSEIQDFIFMLSLDSENIELKNKNCDFSIEIKTYRNNPGESGGIYAKRILKNKVTTGEW